MKLTILDGPKSPNFGDKRCYIYFYNTVSCRKIIMWRKFGYQETFEHIRDNLEHT